MKRAFTFLLALLMVLSLLPANLLQAYAAQVEETTASTEATTLPPKRESEGLGKGGNCGETVTWSLDESGTLTISGIGAMADFEAEKAPWFPYAEEIETIVVEEGVTVIGTYAFAKLTGAKELHLPASVTDIRECAFYYNSATQRLYLADIAAWMGIRFHGDREHSRPNHLELEFELYLNGEPVTELVIPGTVSRIPEHAFYGCSSLKILTVSEGVTAVEGSAFDSCENLTKVTLPDSLREIGSHAFEECGRLSELTLGKGLETIGNTAFGYCKSLKTLALPEGLTTISDRAFMNCENLESISIPASIRQLDVNSFQSCAKLAYTVYDNAKYLGHTENPYAALVVVTGEVPACEIHPQTVAIASGAFSNCDELQTIRIPEGVMAIGDGAFYSCDGLTTVNIPETVTHIGQKTFSGCKNLTAITIGKNVRSMDQLAFAGCVSIKELHITDLAAWCDIEFAGSSANPLFFGGATMYLNGAAVKKVEYPQGATEVKAFAFANYQGLTAVKLPDSVRRIGQAAFADCNYLTSVSFGKGVESIGWGAFAFCVRLKTVTIPGNVTTIEDYAFENAAMTKLTLSEGLKYIGEGAFSYCGWLKKVTVPGSVEYIGKDAFRSCTAMTSVTLKKGVPYVADGMFRECSSIKSVSIPDTVRYIGDDAFYRNHRLKSVKIPNSVERIGNYAFGTCGLKSLFVPSSVRTIGEGAFSGCDLTSATISEGVVTIGDSAFYSCRKLKSVTVPSTVTTIGADAFGLCYGMKTAVLGNRVTQIPEGLFADCYELTTVTIPGTVTAIAKDAFQKCNKLKTVYFSGTREAWTALSRDIAELQNVTVYFPQDVSKLSAPKATLEKDGIHFRWTGVPYAENYEIYRATSKSGKYTLVATVAENIWSDPDNAKGATCYYKVKALRTVPNQLRSSYSNVISIVYECSAPEISGEANEKGKPVITWEKIAGAKKYTVYRATSETGKYTKLGTTTKLTYTDSKAKTGTLYFYKVIANGSKSTYNSGYSNIVSCNVLCSTPAVTIQVDDATGAPSLSWKKIDRAAGYRIYRLVSGDREFTVIAEQTAVTFLDKDAPFDTHCAYMVQAIGKTSALDSELSQEVVVTSAIARPVLKGSIRTDGKPAITWEPIEGATGYQVYRSTRSSKSYQLVATVEAPVYTDETVAPGKTYYYKVVAVSVGCCSAESVYVKLTGKCAAPAIRAEANEKGKPVISWEKVEGARKYTIYRATSEGGKYTKLGTTTKLTYTDSKAAAGKTYFYKIVANPSSSKYNSAYSNICSCSAE